MLALNSKLPKFSHSDYTYIFEMLNEAELCDEILLKKVEKSLVANLIVSTGYWSGCNNPVRYIIFSLTKLIVAKKVKVVYTHQPNETIKERITPLLDFPGGVSDCIEACSILLEIIALRNHLRTIEDDFVAGENNVIIFNGPDFYKNHLDNLKSDFANLPSEICILYNDYYKRAIEDPMGGIWI